VIATLERPRPLELLLSAVARLDTRPVETIVVDNSVGDPLTRSVAEQAGAAYVTAAGTGLSGARNIGARKASGEVVAFVDDDALPVGDWLAHLVAPFADERVVAVAGRVVPVKVSLESERLFAAHGGLDLGPIPRVVDLNSDHWFEICNFGGFGHGGNLAVRRSAFDEWHGFNEALGVGTQIPGGEEHYAWFQLVRAGHRVVYAPEAVVEHSYPRTMEALRGAHLRRLTALSGYVTLFLVEEPAYRGRTLRYLWDAARGTRRTWRTSPSRAGVRIVPRHRALLALLGGVAAYAQTASFRRASRRHRRAT
jgi:cellulose synthase/poly-beta-1,6-N-acetylglucosamine synthase-like glycosyltransferase